MQRIFTALAVFLLALPSFGQAQLTTQALGGGPALEFSPTYPGPNSVAMVTLSNYAGDANQNSVSWWVNGTEQIAARNQRELSFSTGKPGEPVVIEAATAFGRIRQTLKPQYVDLVVEPQTRVPIHYGGRALPSVGSMVNATAITSDPTPTQNLTYTWRLNGTVLGGGPTRGRAQVSFVMPTGGGVLEVLIESSAGVVGAQNVQLLSTDPFLHFYSYNSLYGLSLIPIGENLTLIGNSATVRAEPYYLDLRTFNSPDLAQWSSTAGSPGTNPYELTITRSGAPASASFHVRNLTDVLQGAQGEFGIQ